MKLYFIRHGETDWNVQRRAQGQEDIPLNDYGRYLAVETSKGFKDIPIDLCITSPLCRARETAEIILEEKNVPILEDKRLMEVGFGTYEGMIIGGPYMDEKAKDFVRFFHDPVNYEPQGGGESIKDLVKRATNFIDDLLNNENYSNKNILISTHGAILRGLIGYLDNKVSLEHFFDTPVSPNCGITIVKIDKNKKATFLERNLVFYKDEIKLWRAGE